MKPKAIPRLQAVRALTSVLSQNKPLDEAFLAIDLDALDSGARAWLTEVCSGTLRWKGRLELILDSYALKKKPSGWLRKILLVATYQLIVGERSEHRVHPGAVVSETVSEIKKKEGEAPARFANALLRKVADHAEEWKKATFSSDQELALWASLPEWFWWRLVKQQGKQWALDFAQASLARPEVWVRARSSEWSGVPWASEGPMPLSWKVSEGGNITEKAGFKEGSFIVQDISSQRLVREISSLACGTHGAGSALDLCAAPGGKTIGLHWAGWKVTATDHGEERLSLLRSSLKRVGATEVAVMDSEVLPPTETFDLVWVDAPCTGSGIIRRHPDVKWVRQEKDIASLNQTQIALFKKGFEHVKPGGFLAYSVCSVFKEEGPELVEKMLKADGIGLTEVSRWFLVPQEEPWGDGFWAVLLKRS